MLSRGARAASLAGGRRRLASAVSKPVPSTKEVEDEFRVLNFLRKRTRENTQRVIKKDPVAPPRTLAMSTEQHWPSVWPGPRSFHPGTVPLPLRQGFPLRQQAPPGPLANAELMKIPNFLHLTPPAIRSQCEALKQFCTPWPEGLKDDKECEKFPIEIISSDYCHSGPSIRDPLSRIVSVRIKLSHLTLDQHARDKLLRLVGDRYDEETDHLTIVADRCPVKVQNQEYALYLLTAVFNEAWTVEPWEAEKMEADMETYIWEKNPSRRSTIEWFTYEPDRGGALSDEDVENFDVGLIPEIDDYREAVTEVINVGENEYQMKKYKRAVCKMFNLPVEHQLEMSSSNKTQ